ncbi:hypothetical protein PybrP1_004505 [[Pythium] brassicae (nom. inval.)]|nr:hypothetical protein PybrP1_004505 [[Pythium] brassicae (nom. inval.)]
MAWRNLAYGSQQVADAAPTVAPNRTSVRETVVPQVDASSVPKNDGAKVYKILEYLCKVPMHKAVSARDIFQHTGVDLTMDDQVDQRLKNNPKVRLEGELYAYQAKYDIKNRLQLLRILDRWDAISRPVDSADVFHWFINQIPEGMPIDDLIDCYGGVEDDLKDLAHSGEVICIKNAEKGADVYYPRGTPYLVDVSGVATVEPGAYYVHSSQDVTEELRRGDSVRVGDQWARVSAAIKTSSSTRPLVFAGTTSKSVSSTRDLNVSKKIRYMFKFDKDHLPLDIPLHERHPAAAKVDASRRQAKRRMKEETKKSRTRKQRDIKISNQHLIGTELGEILAKGGQESFTLGAVKFDKQ